MPIHAMLSVASMATPQKRNRLRPRHRRVPPVYLKAWLDHLKITQSELAARLGVHKSVISNLISGRTDLGLEATIAIAEELGIEDRDLFRHPESIEQKESEALSAMSEIPDGQREDALLLLSHVTALLKKERGE